MNKLRRLLPSFAVLLAALVAVQTTDLFACADEAGAAEHGQSHLDGTIAQGAHDVPSPGGSHDEDEHEGEEGSLADCLCHVVFAPTAVVPEVGGRPASEASAFVYVASALPEVEPLGLDPVPLS